jgi:hypothetical protein
MDSFKKSTHIVLPALLLVGSLGFCVSVLSRESKNKDVRKEQESKPTGTVDNVQVEISKPVEKEPAAQEIQEPSVRRRALRWRNPFREMVDLFDEFFNDEFFTLEKIRPQELTFRDSEAVSLPTIAIEKQKDGTCLTLVIKGLTAKKEEINAEYDEEEGYTEVTFPYNESKITLKIYPYGFSVAGEKKITQEKKDAKGTVLSSSSYRAYNSRSQSFPYAVNVSTVKPSYNKDEGTLTLPINARALKRSVSID